MMKSKIPALILPIISDLKRLKPGESLVYKTVSKAHANRIRNALYRYMRIHDIKSHYRIILEQDKILRILNLFFPAPVLLSRTALTETEAFVRDHLIECQDEDSAIEIIKKALDSGDITENDIVPILEEFNTFIRDTANSRTLEGNYIDSLNESIEEEKDGA